MLSMLLRTKLFFSMLNLHMCSGKPVVADCMCELIGGLRAIAQRQFGLRIEFAGLLHHFEKLGDGESYAALRGAWQNAYHAR